MNEAALKSALSSWNLQNNVIAGSGGFRCGPDFWKVLFQSRAVIGPELQNGQFASGEVLLIAEVFIGKKEKLEPGVFGCCKELTIRDPRPALQSRCGEFVTGKSVAHLRGNAFVEQDFHAAA